ncbi:MAG: phytanoyl-CoA dioxygenase family protein [Alphaproteobacteria bacterium]|nr:phytanoyl-CoA dioxygenase family protein [Alphaproteobacteria bacterium]
MLEFNQNNIDAEKACDELLDGDGAILIKNLFTADEVKNARDIIHHHSNQETPKVTHFQGKAEKSNNLHLQRRVWNLLNKGDIFIKMATHPLFKDVLSKFLGDEFIMGSIAANRILAGGPGQEPHIDYPYWDYYKKSAFPPKINTSFPMNAQVTIMLDEFTAETGATAFMPKTQSALHYPDDEAYFHKNCSRMFGEAGDAVIFFGAVWHCAMPNISADKDRSAVLIQYLPKFIVPMENMTATLDADVLKNASPYLLQLLGENVPYPEILEEAKGKNTIGIN